MRDPEPGFEQRTRDSFARQPAMATLGVTIEAVAAGRVVLSMPHRAELTQQHGFVHAGMVATALDSACGYAAFTLMPAGAGVLTSSTRSTCSRRHAGRSCSSKASSRKPAARSASSTAVRSSSRPAVTSANSWRR
jgi:uncharacterized protein (TIGR00369 family)